MAKLCCFQCPGNDQSEKCLEDFCPQCGLQYGFPLTQAPSVVRDYSIVRALGRGFYSATYVAERGALRNRSVLKVSPVSFYEFFEGKDFKKECENHARVAEGSEHIIGIRDMLSESIMFGDISIPCNVAELDFVPGKPLSHYLDGREQASAPAVAQIAIDLCVMLEELRNHEVNHNDLHSENVVVEHLRPNKRRAQAVDDSIRALAIDLGSLSDESKSDSEKLRLGDLHWVASHLQGLSRNLVRDPDRISDQDSRLASALLILAQEMSSRVENQRLPASSDVIGQIEEAFYRVRHHWRPWSEGLSLRSFGTSYNAQTLQAWHVPQLLVDPEGQWVSSITSPGPQVITGMRGCGKTMLLRALQFHARAVAKEGEQESESRNRVRNDDFVGLFVSAQRLLERPGEVPQGRDPFGTLFVAYGLEAVRAVHHLRDLDESWVSDSAYRDIAMAVGSQLEGSAELDAVASAFDLENRLLLTLTGREGADKVDSPSLRVHPNAAFPVLAEAIQRCSPIWHGANVLFLLDDVSTRYLSQERVEELLSALLFQSASCAFKLTSEAQTIELGLMSPGQVHPARVGRDLAVFDLGAEVYARIKAPGSGGGRDFVESILRQRVRHFAPHPRESPRDVLGDEPLEVIAGEIGKSAKSSRDRKRVYRGISALSGVCVGDIGDVIVLYEQILKKSDGKELPVPAEIQSECFQEFCARRLYDLNRRGGFLKDMAKSFAEASNRLLVRSYAARNCRRRLRQYSSLYVRITTGDLERQTERLRELIDAGVFVFAGGSSVPRTKTRDSNPIQQFKLTYRKIYGLVNFIGLAERDRFELSGAALEEWLEEPSKGTEILLRHLGGDDPESSEDFDVEGSEVPGEEQGASTPRSEGSPEEPSGQQISLFEGEEASAGSEPLDGGDAAGLVASASDEARIEEISRSDLGEAEVDCALVGLGFEERSLESVRRLCSTVRLRSALAIKYPEPGRGDSILATVGEVPGGCSVLEYDENIGEQLPATEGGVIVDITGLAKPIIFHAIRNELRQKGQVWICHTDAVSHYPLEEELGGILDAERSDDPHSLLDELRDILTGEEGPYVADALLASDTDFTRQRVLCAFSSPKHERLLSLLDGREYDRIEIVAPKSNTARNKVAQIVAEVAARNNVNASVEMIDSNDIGQVFEYVIQRYNRWYIRAGLGFEFGLTGSKLQAVACAAASAAVKVTQCWYVRPSRFDPDRFTKGVGATRYFSLSLRQASSQG